MNIRGKPWWHWLLINDVLLNSVSAGDWCCVIPEMNFSPGLCAPNLHLKFLSVPEWESKVCSGAQKPSFLAELGPQGGSSEESAHTVRRPSVPETLHVRVPLLHGHRDHMCWNWWDFKYSICSFVICFLSLTLICSPPSEGREASLIS